jgi:hypothetical protein
MLREAMLDDFDPVSDRPPGSLLSTCSFPGCVTLTMGGTCVEHDVPITIDFPRGRPFVGVRDEVLAGAAVD